MRGYAVLPMVLATSVAFVSSASAQSSQRAQSKARKLAGEALDLYEAGDYEAALGKFSEADTLVPAPTLKLRVARCLNKLDRVLEAKEKYREVIQAELKRWAPRVHHEAQKDAKADLKQLLDEIPKLIVVVEGEGAIDAQVTLDGERLDSDALTSKRDIDPGVHTFEARLGEREVVENLAIKRGDDRRIVLVLPDPVIEKPPVVETDDTLWLAAGWGSVAVGGVGVVMGAVAGILVLNDEEGLIAQCPNRQCPPAVRDDVSAFNTRRNVATAGFVIGGIGLTAGTVLLLLKPDAGASETAILPFVSPFGAGLQGRF